MGVIHTMLYEAHAQTVTDGVPIKLAPVNDGAIKPKSAYGNGKLKGILSYYSVYTTDITGGGYFYTNFKNSNDIRKTTFGCNGAQFKNANETSVNPLGISKGSVGYIEGNDRILPEMSTNDIEVVPSGSIAPKDGGFYFTVLVFIEYDGLASGVSPNSNGKSMVAFDLDLNASASAMGFDTWVSVYNGDPGLIAGAEYAFKSATFIQGGNPLNPLVRFSGVSSMGGLEFIIPLPTLGWPSQSEFIADILPMFPKQAFDISVRAKGSRNGNPTWTLNKLCAELLTNRNAIA